MKWDNNFFLKYFGFGVVARVLVVLAFLVVLVVYHASNLDTKTLLLLEIFCIFASAALIYFWAGWSATRKGFELIDSLKMSVVLGAVEGAVFSSTGSSGLLSNPVAFVLAVVAETAFAVLFMMAGAVLAKKIRIR